MLFECFQVIVKRTKLKARFEPVTEHEDAWTRVEVGIVNIAAGGDVRVPRLEGAQTMAAAAGPVRQQMLQPAWWSHWLFATSYLGVLSAAIFWSRDLVSAGRFKSLLNLLTMATVLGTGAFIFKGPEYFRYVKSVAIVEAAAAQQEQAAESDAESAVSEKSKSSEQRPSTIVKVPPVAFTKLADEVAQLTDLVGRMAASPSQPSGLPGNALPPPVAPPPDPAAVPQPMQALMSFATNQVPEGPISATAARMQAEAGAGAPVVPQPSSPSPIDLGAGLAMAAAAAPQANAEWQATTGATGFDERWDAQLPADMGRAAPEIYRALRAEGSTSCRDWLNTNFKGSKDLKNPEWVDLWNAATETDYALRGRTQAEAMMLLAGEDHLEIKMRRLAAHVHFGRANDSVSTAMMLAVRPPGAGCDIAPNWLVSEVATYSKAEHQRRQRVTQRGQGRGNKAGPERGKPDKPPKGAGRG